MAKDLEEDAHLKASFDPASCTSSQLRGIFLQHNIPAPSNLKKADLVQLFETKVRPNTNAYIAQRRVKGSTRGIRDLRTTKKTTVPDSQDDEGDEELGDDMMDVDEPAPAPVKRSRAKAPVAARRTRLPRSRSASVVESDEEDKATKQLKRPKAGRARKVVEPPPPPVHEEIKEEDEMDVEIARSPPALAKKRTHEESTLEMVPEIKSSPEGRRKSSGSHRRSSDGVESGFSDYNPFQNEGSDRKKRRKSSFAPTNLPEPEPEMEIPFVQPPAPSTSAFNNRVKPRTSAQSPLVPPSASTSKLSSRKSMPTLRDVLQEAEYDELTPPQPAAVQRMKPRASMPAPGRQGMPSSASMPAFKSYMAPVEMLKSPPEEYKEMVRRASASQRELQPSPRQPSTPSTVARRRSVSGAYQDSPNVTVARRQAPSAVAIRRAVPATSVAAQKLSFGLLGLMLLSYLGFWRQERFNIGYCDSGTGTNARAIERSASLGALSPTCMPCPAHGTCTDGELVTCELDYVRQPSLLSVAGLFPVGDHCAPDTEKLVKVADQAKRVHQHLRKYRGLVECGHVPAAMPVAKRRQDEVEAWKVYGMTEEDLKKELIDQREVKYPQAVAEQYFRFALEDLVEHKEIEQGVNANGHLMYAATTADLPAACRAKRAAYSYANERKRGISSVLGAIFTMLYLRSMLKQRKEERESTAELVAIALEKLQEQMGFHYRDQALTPNGWIAPGQLRDQILSHEHSATRRARLWRNVEKIVVGNSNVRRQHAEYRGEPTDVWEWIGPLGLLEAGEHGTPGSAVARRKSKGGARVSFGGKEESLYPNL